MKKYFWKLIATLITLLILLTACDMSNIFHDMSSGYMDPTIGDNAGVVTENVPEDCDFEIHFIDVGQADCALVKCDGKTMLIDAGNREDSDLIYTYLKNQGISYLDVLLITHGHEDHVGGAAGALNAVTVGTAYCSVTEYNSKVFSNFVNYLNKQGKKITVPSHGDTFMLGSAYCQIVGPISQSDEPNNTSLVLLITYNGKTFLFTGDAETDEENEILDAGYNVKCDVLKVGHHGSETSTGYRWLKAAAPAYAVISCGKDNSYGHPHEGPLSKLRDADVKVFRTDMQGTIICYVDGNTIGFATNKNGAADTLEGAGEGGNHTDNDSNNTEKQYVLNTNSQKFHLPSCSSAESISEKNKQVVTDTRDNLIEQGYTPCGSCDP